MFTGSLHSFACPLKADDATGLGCVESSRGGCNELKARSVGFTAHIECWCRQQEVRRQRVLSAITAS